MAVVVVHCADGAITRDRYDLAGITSISMKLLSHSSNSMKRHIPIIQGGSFNFSDTALFYFRTQFSKKVAG